MNRRNFIKTAALAPLFGAVGASASTPTAASSGQAWSDKNHPLAGKKLPPWKPGEFQVHFIYTGVAESLFWILPDGTTMLLGKEGQTLLYMSSLYMLDGGSVDLVECAAS